MNYKIPITAVLLCFYVVVGSEEVAENEATSSAEDPALLRVRRGGLSMLRLGRGLQMLRLGKRALPMLRLGRSATPALTDDELQYILTLMRNDRTVPLPRYGKDLSFQYMLMNALKNAELNGEMYDDDEEPSYGYGYDLGTAPERHIRPAPRPGMRYRRSADNENAEVQKRGPPLARYGKYVEDEQALEGNDEVVKRAMRMLRLGRGMRMLRLGKRPMDSEEITEEEKRALRLLRLGKRDMSSETDSEGYTDAEKRALRLLRLGKRDDSTEEFTDEEKRALRLLRLGRSGMDTNDEYTEEDKRALRLLRLGKRPFKMLRLGRSDSESGEADKRALRLLRLGRDSPSEES